jgi:hypothetical protein
MKATNILIPTDFSLASLNAVTALVQQNPDQRFNIVLVHFLQLSDSITELLMLSRRSREYQHISPEFEAQLNELRTAYSDQITTIGTEFFYGSTVAVFRNYLETKQTERIIMLQGHSYAKITANSIDPTLLLQRSGCRLAILKPNAPVRLQPEERATKIIRSKLEYQLL